jgi:Leucine-rich repeat (LRR) protein
VTNRDKKDSIRGRMADAGEPFNVARRKVEALGGNQLTVLPSEIGQLTNLDTLRLEGNQLTVLPPEIGQLASLRRLALDGNRLTTLPRELADLLSGGLELGLAGNPLQGPILEIYGQGPQALASHLRGLE